MFEEDKVNEDKENDVKALSKKLGLISLSKHINNDNEDSEKEGNILKEI